MRPSPTRTGRHAGLTREDVIDGALRLIEAGGAQALTMRGLAADLGVSATSIYWHVGGRDELVLALIESHGERLAERPVEGATSRERVMSAARQVWDSALEHPEVMKLAHAVGATSMLEKHLEVALAQELCAAGLHGEDARDALRAILICVGGFLVLALRRADAVPAHLASTALWADLEAPGVDAATRRALTSPVDLAPLFERTVQAVVDSYLPGEPSTGDQL